MITYILVTSALVVFAVLSTFWFVRRQLSQEFTSTHSRAEEQMGANVEATVADALNRAVQQLGHAQNENLRGSIDSVINVASSKLGDQLLAGKHVIDRERAEIDTAVTSVNSELQRMNQLVVNLQKDAAQQTGQVVSGIEQSLKVTAALQDTTQGLRQTLSSSQARGQWGERMAEDVLTAAGFLEGVNYTKQTKHDNGGIPDFTFSLPRDQVVHMDVKFPFDNYLRWLESDVDSESRRYAKEFSKDVRNRVKEIGARSYNTSSDTLDYVILFVPNESVYGFLHEHDTGLIDFALKNKVVLCSPTTLFAVLAVIRQAVDSFTVSQRGDEILACIDGLRIQWDKWCEPVEKMNRGLQSAQKAFDELNGTRKRTFEKELEKLEAIRDGELTDGPPALTVETPEVTTGSEEEPDNSNKNSAASLFEAGEQLSAGATPRAQQAEPLRSVI